MFIHILFLFEGCRKASMEIDYKCINSSTYIQLFGSCIKFQRKILTPIVMQKISSTLMSYNINMLLTY